MTPAVVRQRALVLLLAAAAAWRPGPARAQPARPAAPAREVVEVALAFDRARGLAGTTALLHVRLRDAAGRAADAPLRLEADGGAVDPPVRVAEGVFTARLTLPTALDGRRSVLVIAAAGQGAASATLPVTAGPPAAVAVESPADLAADGAVHPLSIAVRDAYGNPADDPPRAHARRGWVGQPVPLAAGTWLVDYRPRRDSRAGEDVIRVEAGSASASTRLRLAPVPPLLAVSPRAGLVLGAGGPAAALGADVATWGSFGAADLGLVLGATWWTAGEDRTVAGPAGPLALRTRHDWLPVTLSLATRRPLGARWSAALSAGGGAALIASRTRLAGQAEVSETGWAPAATAALELALHAGPGQPFAEVRGAWLGDPRLDTLRGAAWPVFVSLGYRLDAY